MRPYEATSTGNGWCLKRYFEAIVCAAVSLLHSLTVGHICSRVMSISKDTRSHMIVNNLKETTYVLDDEELASIKINLFTYS